eukprot:1243476-Rhodomonas_salina.2
MAEGGCLQLQSYQRTLSNEGVCACLCRAKSTARHADATLVSCNESTRHRDACCSVSDVRTSGVVLRHKKWGENCSFQGQRGLQMLKQGVCARGGPRERRGLGQGGL